MFLQLIAAHKVDYSGTLSREFDDLMEDPSIPKKLLKDFLVSGAVRKSFSGLY